MASWDEIEGKLKQVHDVIESAYNQYVESSFDKVKLLALLNIAAKMSLSAIPIIDPNLEDLDNIGEGNQKRGTRLNKFLDF